MPPVVQKATPAEAGQAAKRERVGIGHRKVLAREGRFVDLPTIPTQELPTERAKGRTTSHHPRVDTPESPAKLCEGLWHSAKLCADLRRSASLRKVARGSAKLRESVGGSVAASEAPHGSGEAELLCEATPSPSAQRATEFDLLWRRLGQSRPLFDHLGRASIPLSFPCRGGPRVYPPSEHERERCSRTNAVTFAPIRCSRGCRRNLAFSHRVGGDGGARMGAIVYCPPISQDRAFAHLAIPSVLGLVTQPSHCQLPLCASSSGRALAHACVCRLRSWRPSRAASSCASSAGLARRKSSS